LRSATHDKITEQAAISMAVDERSLSKSAYV
jgi:hypothetical protein